MSGVRQAATPEEIAEARDAGHAVREAATPEEIAEARGSAAPSPDAPPGMEASPVGWRKVGAQKTLAEQDPAGEKLMPKMWGALAAAAHGPAMAMEGPVNGAIAAAKEAITNPLRSDNSSVVNAYRKARNAVEGAQVENLLDFPHAPIVGALLTNPGSAATAAGRIGMAGGQGAAYGFGSSKADLTNGEVGPALADAGKGLGIGIGAGVAGEVAQALARGAGNKLSGVLQKNADTTREAAEKALASARGSYGGEVSSASRTLELLEKAASDPNLPEDLSRQASEFLAGPEAQQLRQQVIRSSLGRGPDQLARIQSARDAMAEAGQALQPSALNRAAQARLDNPSALVRRLRDLAPKVAAPVIGGALAGPFGAGAGALAAAAAGRPSTTISNLFKDPYVASRLLGASTATAAGAGGAIARGVPVAAMSDDPMKPYLDLLEEKKP